MPAAKIFAEPATITGSITGTVQLTLAPGHRIHREISEWFGAPMPLGSYLRIVSDQPAQVLGLLGNDATGVVLPIVTVN